MQLLHEWRGNRLARNPSLTGNRHPRMHSDLDTARRLRSEGKHEDARALLAELVKQQPGNAQVQYEAACVHDSLGREADAIPFYTAALLGDLPPSERCGALVGLGSTYRTLGMFEEAERTLLTAKAEFGGAQEVEVFLAMTRHNMGRSKEAVEALLRVLVETSRDESIQAYGRAIALYAENIDRTWPSGVV